MKVLAKDLKHGQRFRRSSEDAIAAGLVDSDGCAIAIHAVAKRTLFIPGYIEVELIDPPAEPADCVVVGAGDSRVVEPAIDPGPGYRLLRKGELVQEGDDVYMDDEYGWESSSNDGWPQGRGFSYRRRIEPTYRPYTDAELLEQLGAKVRLKSKDRSHGRLIAGVDLGTAVIGLERVSAEALRNKYEHLDGTPCGMEE